MAPRCSLNPETYGKIYNRILPNRLPNSGDCKKNCDSQEECIAWQYLSYTLYCRLSLWAGKQSLVPICVNFNNKGFLKLRKIISLSNLNTFSFYITER